MKHMSQILYAPTTRTMNMTPEILQEWPEPVVSVQSLSESGEAAIPERYVKPPTERAVIHDDNNNNIPVIDLTSLLSGDVAGRGEALRRIGDACGEWGFFQVVNHGVSVELMDRAREVWREFFHAPVEVKRAYANSPRTYEGYGSRLGIQKGAVLDWSDYYYLHYRPSRLKDHLKWPTTPSTCREVIEEYLREVVKLCGELMKAFSVNLGLSEEDLLNAFGGDDIGAALRVNFFPKCPQPDLTLGLSPHSDPGGITILLADPAVPGLQVRRGDRWLAVNPTPHAFIVNIGDQIQILSNGIYKSVEHRVIVNSNVERISLALFYNPKGDIPIGAMEKLVTRERPAMPSPMTFEQYRDFVRMKGLKGKTQVESLTSPRCNT